MPDGDRFERRLRGKFWAVSYRLTCGGHDLAIIADRLTKACAAAIRDGMPDHVDIIRRVVEKIKLALWLEAQAQKGDLFQSDNFLYLIRELNELPMDGAFDLKEYLCDAAKSTFVHLRKEKQAIERREVSECFAEFMVKKLVEGRFLDHVQEGVMEKTSRQKLEQEQWKTRLFEELAQSARQMIGGIVQDKDRVVVRAPKTKIKRKETTLELLNQPMRVSLGGK
jgi:hypothetical protein